MKRRRFYNAINKKSGTETLRIELLEDQVVFNIIFWGDQGLWDSFGHWSICFVISTWCFQRCCWTFFTPVLAWLFFPFWLIIRASYSINKVGSNQKKQHQVEFSGYPLILMGVVFPGIINCLLRFLPYQKIQKKTQGWFSAKQKISDLGSEAHGIDGCLTMGCGWSLGYEARMGLKSCLGWLVGWLVQKTTWAFNKPGWLVIIVRGWLVGWLVGY